MVWSPSGAVVDPFEAEQRYQIIYADPPWQYRDRAEAGRRGAGHKYSLLSNRDVAALPVARIAAPDAMLFLWVTWPKLPEVLPVIDAWGFSYRTAGFVWVKRTRLSGALAWGMGSWTRANTEPCLLATRGRPRRLSAGVHQVVEAPLARHSEKPAVVRERIVQLAGDCPRIELFAREAAPGWDAWGDDLGSGGWAPPPVAPALPRVDTVPRPDRRSRRPTTPDHDPEQWHRLRGQLAGHLSAHGPTSRRDLEHHLGWSSDVARAVLTRLVREGAVIKHGRRRGTRYGLVTGAADHEATSNR